MYQSSVELSLLVSKDIVRGGQSAYVRDYI